MAARAKERCAWAGTDPLMVRYHDEEWGVPSHDDRHLFEMLVLEGAQAGLSWSTILRKREAYQRAFDGFEVAKVARFNQRRIERLLADPGIVRNRLKILSAVANARLVLEVQRSRGSFSELVWSFVGGRPRINRPASLREIPARTDESIAMSKALAKLGFRFVGPTILYAFMQACGLVDDHQRNCFRARPPA
jgi:DNA-3-methyladenine glycosylase I